MLAGQSIYSSPHIRVSQHYLSFADNKRESNPFKHGPLIVLSVHCFGASNVASLIPVSTGRQPRSCRIGQIGTPAMRIIRGLTDSVNLSEG
jgi:hypothetical protein